MKALVLYSFLPPDPVVSAEHMSGVSQFLSESGYEVEGWSSIRNRRFSSTNRHKKNTKENNITFYRVWIPNLNIDKKIGRIISAFILLFTWIVRLCVFRKKFDLIVLGSDPLMGYAIVPVLRFFRVNTKIVYWCLDHYPGAFVSAGILSQSGIIFHAMMRFHNYCMKKMHTVFVIDENMKRYFFEHITSVPIVTLYPWGLSRSVSVKQTHLAEYRQEFGINDGEILFLLTGNYGLAHHNDKYLELLKSLVKSERTHLLITVKGVNSRAVECLATKNVTISAPVQLQKLELHLQAADVHVISMDIRWQGVVFPSKITGALQAGRPILFLGPKDSSIGKMLENHRVGWLVFDDLSLERAINLISDCKILMRYRKNCKKLYLSEFDRLKAKKIIQNAIK